MIFALSRSIESYDLEYNGKRLGLWTSYGHDPHLFCLLSRSNSAFFMYEDGFDDFPTGKKVSMFDEVLIEAFQATLRANFAGELVRTWMETTTPRQWLNILLNNDAGSLPYAALFPNQSSADMIRTCTLVRTLQFEKFYRGVTAVNDNVVVASFRSGLIKEEELYLQESKEQFKKAMLERTGGADEK